MAVTNTVTGSLDTAQAGDKGIKSLQFGGGIREDVIDFVTFIK